MTKNNLNKVILVQGFGWTGSGAIIDFLLENENIKLVSNDEVPFLKLLISLINKAKKRKKISIDNGSEESLFLGNFPSNFSDRLNAQYKERITRFFSLSNVNKLEYWNFAIKLLKKIEEISKRPKYKKVPSDEINQIITNYFTYLNSIFYEEGKILVYDNLLYLQRLYILKDLDFSLIGKIQLYVVDRDPRDQFFELFNLYKSNYEIQYNKIFKRFSKISIFRHMMNTFVFQYCAALAFIYIYHKPKRLGFYKSLKLLKCSNVNTKIIEFEKFVLNTNNLRENIKNEINLLTDNNKGCSVWLSGKKFKQNVSQQNIGIYKKDTKKIIYNLIIKRVSKYKKVKISQ